MLFLSGYSGVVGDYLRSSLGDYHLLPSLRRKFATIALVNSLLTTLLYYTMVILICWVWPCEAGYTVNLNFPRFLPAKSGSLGCLLEEGGNIF